jgi:hypothetical protein
VLQHNVRPQGAEQAFLNAIKRLRPGNIAIDFCANIGLYAGDGGQWCNCPCV